MYSATDKKTWEPDDTRQIPPGKNTKKTILGRMSPGDACFDAFFSAWRGILCIESVPGKSLVEVIFEDGGMAYLPPTHIFYVCDNGSRGWSEPQQSHLYHESSTTFSSAMNRLLLSIQTPEAAAHYKNGRKYVTVFLGTEAVLKVDAVTGDIKNRSGRPLGSIYDANLPTQ